MLRSKRRKVALALVAVTALPAAAAVAHVGGNETISVDAARTESVSATGAPGARSTTTPTITLDDLPGTTVPAPAGAALPSATDLVLDPFDPSGAPPATPPSVVGPAGRPNPTGDGTIDRPNPTGDGTTDPGPGGPSFEPDAHDTVPGAGGLPPGGATDPDLPIGGFDDDGPVPPGLDLVAPPKAPKKTNGLGGPGGLAIDDDYCWVQCITKGVAYPRGFGALLVVETSVPAEYFLTLVADLDHNGSYEDLHVETTPPGTTHHEWAVDDLEPGTTYYGMVAATDAQHHTSYAWGQFTTLSTRTVSVVLGDGEITGGPGNIKWTRYGLTYNHGDRIDLGAGDFGILQFAHQPRHVDVGLVVTRSWENEKKRDLCEVMGEIGLPQGHDDTSCIAWNSGGLNNIDLDVAPAGSSHWTDTTINRVLATPTVAEGGALPAGYGDPYWFDFSLPLTLHVSYS